jgi:hypothetical protein
MPNPMRIRMRIVVLLLLCASISSDGHAQAVTLRIEGSELRGRFAGVLLLKAVLSAMQRSIGV